LVGETLREIGILASVFVPLDAAFGGVETNVLAVSNTPTKHFVVRWLMVYSGATVILIWGLVRMYLEKRDRKREQQ
jgi:hypothetical protein